MNVVEVMMAGSWIRFCIAIGSLLWGAQLGWSQTVLREDFVENPAHMPVVQEDLVQGHMLSLERLGPGADRFKRSYHPNKANDPHYLWNGPCQSEGAVLFHFSNDMDLSAGDSKVQLRTKNSGESVIHLLMKVADDWICAEDAISQTKDWEVSAHQLREQRWRVWNVESLGQGELVADIDWSKADGLGFFFPVKSTGSKDCIRLDWFEVSSSSMKVNTAEPVFGSYIEPEAGVFRSAFVFEGGGKGLNRVRRGVLVRLSNKRWAAFDPDLLRWAAVWKAPNGAAPISLDSMAAISYPDARAKAKTPPKIHGQLEAFWAERPGVAVGSELIEDPRLQKIGPLPLEVGQWSGVVYDETKPSLHYLIGNRKISERVDGGDEGGFQRTLSIGEGNETISILLAEDLGWSKADSSDVFHSESGGVLSIQSATSSQVEVVNEKGQGVWLRCASSEVEAEVVVSLSQQGKSDVELTPVSAALPLGGSLRVESPVLTDRSPGWLHLRPLNLPEANPWNRAFRPVDVAFQSNGDAFVATFDGDVWRVRGLDEVEARWDRVAMGLYEPMGIAVGNNDEVFVFGKDQITELRDRNGDGIFDAYWCRSDRFIQSLHTRDYAMSLEIEEDGSFLVAKGGIFSEGRSDDLSNEMSSHRGTVLRISPDGNQVSVLAEGFRIPYVGRSPSGRVMVSDQQGNFVPSTPIHFVPDNEEVRSFGFAFTEHTGGTLLEAAIWLPHLANRSAAGFAPFEGKGFPELKGATAHFSWNGRLFVLPHDRREAAFAWAFATPFDMPLLNGDFHPKTGDLYAIGLGISGYKVTTPKEMGMVEIRRNKAMHPPSELRLARHQIEVTLAGALPEGVDPKVIGKQVSVYNVIRTKKYGSGHFLSDGAPGTRSIPVSEVEVLEGRERVVVHLAEPLFDYSILEFTMDLGERIDLYATPRGLTPPTEDEVASIRAAISKDENAPSEGRAVEGEKLFQTLGCVTCHSLTGEKLNGPVFVGKSLEAEYVKESILFPTRHVVEGYQPSMPSYQGILSSAQLADLVAYVVESSGRNTKGGK